MLRGVPYSAPDGALVFMFQYFYKHFAPNGALKRNTSLQILKTSPDGAKYFATA